MRACSACRRHVFAAEERCPFCDATLPTATWGLEDASRSAGGRVQVVGLALGVSLFACGPSVPIDDETSTGADSTSTSSGPTSNGSNPMPETSSDAEGTSSSTDPGSSDDEWDDSSCGFYGGCPTDFGSVDLECDVWSQDCPNGEKCMPWANDGGDSWNATRCSPIAPDADAIGQACTAVGSDVSGLDSCELGAMCWGVDPQTLEGTCVAQCTGSPSQPVCSPDLTCVVSNGGVLTLCLNDCDPLAADDCNDTEVCAPFDEGFVCVPGGPGAGGHGDACSDGDPCGSGTICIDAAQVPGCTAATCCSSLCEFDDPEPPCPDPEQACLDVFDRNPGFGVCGIPG